MPAPPPAQIGPAVSPSPNAGLAVKAMSDVRNAVKMLETALPQIPMGTPLHAEILNATKSLLKHLHPGDQSSGLELMSLLQMARHAAQAQPMQALQRAFPQNPAAPPVLAQQTPGLPAMAA